MASLLVHPLNIQKLLQRNSQIWTAISARLTPTGTKHDDLLAAQDVVQRNAFTHWRVTMPHFCFLFSDLSYPHFSSQLILCTAAETHMKHLKMQLNLHNFHNSRLFVFFSGATGSCSRGLFMALHSVITPGMLEGIYEVLRIDSMSATGKASALSIVLPLQSPTLVHLMELDQNAPGKNNDLVNGRQWHTFDNERP